MGGFKCEREIIERKKENKNGLKFVEGPPSEGGLHILF